MCVIPHTVEVVANEVALERALVASSRSASSMADVKEYLHGRFGVEPGSFLVHPYYPEEFLIMFRDFHTMIRVLHAPVPEGEMQFVFR